MRRRVEFVVDRSGGEGIGPRAPETALELRAQVAEQPALQARVDLGGSQGLHEVGVGECARVVEVERVLVGLLDEEGAGPLVALP